MKKFNWMGKTDLYIGTDIISKLDLILKEYINRKIFIVTDSNIIEYYRELIYRIFSKHYNFKLIVIPAGEKAKSMEMINFVLNELVDYQANRNSILVSFGGGVISDITGFVAGIYMRGIDYINIPTTLLAQIDSSIGGKTGVNFRNIKNGVGLFYHPKKVIIDTIFLKTIPIDDFLSGLGEIIKYFYLNSELDIDDFQKNVESYIKNKSLPIDLIYDLCMFKLDVVRQDEIDKGKRRILNLGHTFAHALESANNYENWPHGEAVALGIIFSLILSNKLLNFPKEKIEQCKNLYKLIYGKNKKDDELINVQAIYKAMLYDKKNEKDFMPLFVLLENRGETKFYEINENILIESIKEIKEFYKNI